MRTDGTAVRVHGDDLDTDVMYPGAFLNIEDPAEMASHLFEGFDPSLREKLVGRTKHDLAVLGELNAAAERTREEIERAVAYWLPK